MSGVPFNPMRKTPPPPPHIDTTGIDAKAYITVESRDGQQFLVHRDCLCESPLIRRAFAKRADVQLRDVVIEFVDEADEGAEGVAAAGASVDMVRGAGQLVHREDETDNKSSSLNTTAASPVQHGGGERAGSDNASPTMPRGSTHNVRSSSYFASAVPFRASNATFDASRDDASGTNEEEQAGILDGHAMRSGTGRHSTVPLVDVMQNDHTVRLRFPGLSGATLDTVIAYLYYKHRYDRSVGEPRPELPVPIAAALDVMKLARVLEC